ncbi:MAG TPA: molybdopterin oxidoreductase, partial [Clostridium sp.]|nr:molybdopterin oxidoreductase [Clostridium sp.]
MELKKITCIMCPNGCKLTIIEKNEELLVEGNKCKRGIEFGINEIKNPLRSIASTVNTIYKEMP